MRLEIYYEEFLRRDVMDKAGILIGDVSKVSLTLSCKGLQKVEEVSVVKSLLLLESISSCKSERSIGIMRSRFLGSGRFNSFMCRVILKGRVEIFSFMDRWVSIYGVEFFAEGGRARSEENGGILVVYYNLNDYVEIMPRFNRFKTILGCKVEFFNEDGMGLMMKGLGLL